MKKGVQIGWKDEKTGVKRKLADKVDTLLLGSYSNGKCIVSL